MTTTPFHILYTFNLPLSAGARLQACLADCSSADALLLLENGVYNAAPSIAPQHCEWLQHALQRHCIYVLQPDINTRGLSDALLPGIESIDDAQFVQLVTQYDTQYAYA